MQKKLQEHRGASTNTKMARCNTEGENAKRQKTMQKKGKMAKKDA